MSRSKKILILLAFSTLALSSGCFSAAIFVSEHIPYMICFPKEYAANVRAAKQAANPRQDKDLGFPYVASSQRKSDICRGCLEIQPGMTLGEAKEIVGEYDRIRPLYEPKILHSRLVGKTYWYFMDIADPDDTTNASLMRLSVDDNYTVTKVDYWGFSPQTEPSSALQ